MEVKANTISFGFSVRSAFFENKKTTSRGNKHGIEHSISDRPNPDMVSLFSLSFHVLFHL